MSVAAMILAAALQAPAPAPAAPATSTCRIGVVADLPVTFQRNRPVVPVEIDGKPVRALIDTGATTSLIFQKTAQRLGLHTQTVPELRMHGVDGEVQGMSAHVSSFSLMGSVGRGFDVVMAPGGADVDMLIGEDLLSRYDLEFDLGHGKLRLVRLQGCAEDEVAYWAKTYSVASFSEERGGSIVLSVRLNGASMRSQFDSGAAISVASDAAAERAHVALGGEVGKAIGVGGRGFSLRSGVVSQVSVGDETVANARLSFGPIYRAPETTPTGSKIATRTNVDMLLGADFLRSHHVL